MNFISVKGPELLQQYVGESEGNIRELFENARSIAPCIVFFDEIDSITSKRSDSHSNGISNRLVPQLLVELDACSSSLDGPIA
jgi:SpoVK/Ycf46/Vps4 family AAA+-type ATPase